MSIDMTTNAAVKLEPYLLMSKSAKGAAAAKLIQDATAAPGVFVFSELLEMPNIAELVRSEHAAYHTLLRLFAYGTFEDYLRQKGSLPALNQAQATKLKLLTLVSLSLERRILSYSRLLKALQITTIRELEDLIIDGIYLDIISGKLDQKQQQFEVEYVLGRDVEPEKVTDLLAALREWASTTSSVLSALDTQLGNLASQRAATKEQVEQHEAIYTSTVKEVYEKLKESRASRKHGGLSFAMGGGDRDDRMDIDEYPGGDAGRGKKWRTTEHSKQARKRNRF